MGGGTGRPGNPKLDDATWIAVLERYVRGETAQALAGEHGVSVAALHWQARGRGYRKMDRPDAVYRWAHPPPLPAEEGRAERMGFAFDRNDPDGNLEAVLALAARAAARGRSLDFARLMRVARLMESFEVRWGAKLRARRQAVTTGR